MTFQGKARTVRFSQSGPGGAGFPVRCDPEKTDRSGQRKVTPAGPVFLKIHFDLA